ncbi:LOW QUALITY PROTEIN: profilin-1 [Anomaloglossus baeobatrachus]
MSWQDYIKSLMGPDVRDAAIVGYKPPSVWAAEQGGDLCKITVAEINVLTCEDRSHFFTNGLTLGGLRCSLLRDNFHDDFTLDLRTKSACGPTYNISIGKTFTAYVMAMGKEGVHGGRAQ